MKLSPWQVWLNFLALLPGTLLTILTIAVAFLRFYDEQEQRSSAGSVVSRRSTDDFTILGQITEPRLWSNRLTVAALLVAVVNFGVEEERPRGGFLRKGTRDDWDRRNRETRRLEAEATRAENERIEQARRRREEARRRSEEATRAENERVERRYREIQRDAYGSVFRPTRSRRGKKPSRSRKKQRLKKENARLAELESKIDGLFSKYEINSNPVNPTEEP